MPSPDAFRTRPHRRSGERLALALRVRRMTQVDLARHLGVRQPNISRWIAGITSFAGRLHALAGVLAVPPEWLADGHHPPPWCREPDPRGSQGAVHDHDLPGLPFDLGDLLLLGDLVATVAATDPTLAVRAKGLVLGLGSWLAAARAPDFDPGYANPPAGEEARLAARREAFIAGLRQLRERLGKVHRPPG